MDGIHPAEDIEPLVMLAARPNRRLGPLFHPDPAQFGMQTKTGFIGKQQPPISACVFSQLAEFFLYALRKRQPPPSWPGHSGKPAGAVKNPSAGSIAAPGALGAALRAGAADTPPPPPHPSDCATSRIRADHALSLFPTALGCSQPGEPVGQNEVFLQVLSARFHLAVESTAPHSSDLCQKAQRPGCWSIPSTPIGWQQSESPTRPQVRVEPSPEGPAGSPIRCLSSMLSCHPPELKLETRLWEELSYKAFNMSSYF